MSRPAKTIDEALVHVPEAHLLRKVPMFGLGLFLFFGLTSVVLHAKTEDHGAFFFSWLIAFAYFISIGLGGMFFVLVQHCARAGWSVTVRRLAENAMGTLPWLAIGFVPLFFGLGELYHWTHPEGDPLLEHKVPWLNTPFFVLRTALYFLCWYWISKRFLGLSVEQDSTGDHDTTRRLQWHSGYCLLLFAFTATFAAFDWLMSLEPHWFSTIFGGYYFAGGVVAFFAFMVACVLVLKATGLLGDAVNSEHYHDLGKLVFAFTVFWAYIAFSQFMLIWYGNIPEETVWFEMRYHGGWRLMSQFLIVGHFILPFFFLMPKTIKRWPLTLLAGASWILFVHYVDLYWLVKPTFVKHLDPASMGFGIMDVFTFLAVTGLFLFAFGRLLLRHALVPLKDPRLREALAFENYPAG